MVTREVLQNIAIQEIKLNPGNPRINEETVDRVAHSIEKNEYISPIIIDETNTILAGNTRYKALVKMGRSQIEMVLKILGLTQDQKDNFILADNKSQEFSLWDWSKLSQTSKELLLDVGFTEDEMLRGWGLSDIEKELVDLERMKVIEVDLPGAVKLKSRNCFHCDEESEFKEIQAFFKTDKEGELDKEKLLAMIRGM